MSEPDDANPTSAVGQALITGHEAPRASAEAGGAAAAVRSARPLGSRLLDYSAHAAMIVGLVGFAWTVSNHIVKRPTAAQLEATAPAKAKATDLADLQKTNMRMAEDIRHLRNSLDALRASVHEDNTSAQVRILQAGLENVKTGLNSARSETATAMAQLSGKLARMEHAPATKQDQPQRTARLEKSDTDPMVTASIPPATAKIAAVPPLPPTKPGSIAKSVGVGKQELAKGSTKPIVTADARRTQDERHANIEPAKPQILSNYVVRDVYDGVALIEGRRGPMEVVPGVSIPGAGIVKSIERHGGGWTVLTTKGVLAYAAPPRDYRRASARDYGQPYPYAYY